MKLSAAALTVPMLILTLASCAPYVRSDVNSALIGQVHCGSFAWAGEFRSNSPLRSTIANPINENRLRASIASHLGGVVQPAPGNADCLVGYGIGGYHVVSGGYPYGYGWGWGYYYPYTYPQSVIAVDLYDARTGQPLWHAATEQNLFGATGPDAEKRIDAAVAAIFSKYPYRG